MQKLTIILLLVLVGAWGRCGHGVPLDGANYMVPVDAELAKKDYVKTEVVNIKDVLARTMSAGTTPIIVIRNSGRMPA